MAVEAPESRWPRPASRKQTALRKKQPRPLSSRRTQPHTRHCVRLAAAPSRRSLRDPPVEMAQVLVQAPCDVPAGTAAAQAEDAAQQQELRTWWSVLASLKAEQDTALGPLLEHAHAAVAKDQQWCCSGVPGLLQRAVEQAKRGSFASARSLAATVLDFHSAASRYAAKQAPLAAGGERQHLLLSLAARSRSHVGVGRMAGRLGVQPGPALRPKCATSDPSFEGGQTSHSAARNRPDGDERRCALHPVARAAAGRRCVLSLGLVVVASASAETPGGRSAAVHLRHKRTRSSPSPMARIGHPRPAGSPL